MLTRMKVLFSASPGYGHVHPMMPLAMAYKSAGHEVAWALAEGYSQRAEAAGFRSFRAGLSEPERWALMASRFPFIKELSPEDRPPHMFPKMFGAIGAPAILADLLTIAEQWQPDLFVHDVSEFASAIVAAKLGRAHVAHSFGSRLPLQRFEAAGEEVAPLWLQEGLPVPEYGGTFEHLYLNIWPKSLGDRPDDTPGPWRDLRPVAFDSVGEETLPAWVDELPARPTIYVTFGTVFNIDAPFGPVVDALADRPVNVILTWGPTGDPSRLGPLPANVHTEQYIPQAALFARGCDLVVSHGGSGTTLAACSRGIPQLFLPQGADQFLNAQSSVAAGSALSIPPSQVSSESIGRAVDRLLEDPSFRRAAAGIAGDMSAMPSPEETVGAIDALFPSGALPGA